MAGSKHAPGVGLVQDAAFREREGMRNVVSVEATSALPSLPRAHQRAMPVGLVPGMGICDLKLGWVRPRRWSFDSSSLRLTVYAGLVLSYG